MTVSEGRSRNQNAFETQRPQNAIRGSDHDDAESQLRRGGSLKRKDPEGFMRNARKQERTCLLNLFSCLLFSSFNLSFEYNLECRNRAFHNGAIAP